MTARKMKKLKKSEVKKNLKSSRTTDQVLSVFFDTSNKLFPGGQKDIIAKNLRSKDLKQVQECSTKCSLNPSDDQMKDFTVKDDRTGIDINNWKLQQNHTKSGVKIAKLLRIGDTWFCSQCGIYISSKSTGYRHFKLYHVNEPSKYFVSTSKNDLHVKSKTEEYSSFLNELPNDINVFGIEEVKEPFPESEVNGTIFSIQKAQIESFPESKIDLQSQKSRFSKHLKNNELIIKENSHNNRCTTKSRAKLLKNGTDWYCSKCGIQISSKSTGYRHFKACKIDSFSKYFVTATQNENARYNDSKDSEEYCFISNKMKNYGAKEKIERKEIQDSYPDLAVDISNYPTEKESIESSTIDFGLDMLNQRISGTESVKINNLNMKTNCYDNRSSFQSEAKVLYSGNEWYCSKCGKDYSSKSSGYRHFKACQYKSSKYFGCFLTATEKIETKTEFLNRNKYTAIRCDRTKAEISSNSLDDLSTASEINCEGDEVGKPIETKESNTRQRKVRVKSPFFKNCKLVPEGSRGAHQHISYNPPKSPFNLIQEKLYTNPWKLLIATIFLNVTTSRVAFPILEKFFEMHDTPEEVLSADWRKIADLMQPMGIHEKRARYIIRFSDEYLHKDWYEASELFGIGKYGNDSYRIFCLGQWKHVVPDDHKLNQYHEWITEQYKLGFVK